MSTSTTITRVEQARVAIGQLPSGIKVKSIENISDDDQVTLHLEYNLALFYWITESNIQLSTHSPGSTKGKTTRQFFFTYHAYGALGTIRVRYEEIVAPHQVFYPPVSSNQSTTPEAA